MVSQKAGGVMILFGGFSIFCAFPMFLVAGWRAWHAHRIESRWVETTASVDQCRLAVTHGSGRSSSAMYYSLRCRLNYQFDANPYQFELRTTSLHSGEAANSINDWVEGHRTGAVLRVRVDPSDPRDLAVISELPIHQFPTAREGWMTGVIFLVFGTPLLALGRWLVR
jgi:hypothetical protein